MGGIRFFFLGALLLAAGMGLGSIHATPQQPGQPGATGSVIDANTIAYINEQLKKGWDENKITPSPNTNDYEFVRRVYLDLVGRIPTTKEIQDFLKKPAKTRRQDEVAALLKHEDFAKNWANIWTVWLLTRTSPPGVNREAMRLWLEDAFAVNKPYDKMVEEILTATGKADESKTGAVNFIASHMGERVPNDKRTEGKFEMVPVTARTARLFLATQVQCTQCHNHPFLDSRKQTQYWGMNAFFRQVEREPEVIMVRGGDQSARFFTVRDNPGNNPEGTIFFEQRNGVLLQARPTYLDGTRISIGPGVIRRQELARMVIKDENFARAIVNRLWGHFMGRGFTHPVDDFSEQNQPSNPDLLDRLAKDFIATGYDQRRLMTWITSCNAYHLSSMANRTNNKSDAEPYFARMLLKALSPEQLVDSIFIATNAEQTRTSREDRRKMYDDWLRDFTVNFGDDEGNEATFNGTVVQALMLMNGQKLNETIKNRPGSTLNKVLTLPPAQRLRHLYESALTRPPGAAEVKTANSILARTPSKDPAAAWQDIFWALLNSNEFILNH